MDAGYWKQCIEETEKDITNTLTYIEENEIPQRVLDVLNLGLKELYLHIEQFKTFLALEENYKRESKHERKTR